MISLELAGKLKSAGLEWETEQFDMYLFKLGEGIPEQVGCLWDKTSEDEGFFWNVRDDDRVTWLPRLDQLLTEITKRGYGYVLESTAHLGHCISLWHPNPDVSCCNVEQEDSAEDAAAKALLWILEHEDGA